MSTHRRGLRAEVHARLATALVACGALVGCAAAATPPAPPPSLEQAVAPGAVKPELAGLLADMLRRGEGDFVLPLGRDHARCRLGKGAGGALLECDELSVQGADVLAIVKKIHGGEVQRRLLEGRLVDDARFTAHTGLKPGGLHQRGEGSVARELGEPLGLVLFEVRADGSAVKARLQGAEGPEEKEASSLLELGRWLSERGEALPGERASVSYRASLRDHLGRMLKQLERDERGLGLGGVRVGLSQQEQPSIAAMTTYPHGEIGEFWPKRYRGAAFSHDGQDHVVSGVLSHFVTLDGRVREVSQSFRWRLARPAHEALDCEALTAWLNASQPGHVQAPGATDPSCRWLRREGGVEFDLELQQDGGGSFVVRLVDPAVKTLEASAKQRVAARDRGFVCRACRRIRPGLRVLGFYKVLSVDQKACLMKVQVIRGIAEGELPAGYEDLRPGEIRVQDCDDRTNTYE